MKPEVIIHIDGGVVQGVYSNTDLKVILVDADTEGSLEETLYDDCYVTDYPTDPIKEEYEIVKTVRKYQEDNT